MRAGCAQLLLGHKHTHAHKHTQLLSLQLEEKLQQLDFTRNCVTSAAYLSPSFNE